MAIKKPFKPFSKVDIDKLISKGADIIENDEIKISKNLWTHLNLRIPTSMINEIEQVMKKRVGISRTGWILEAIQEKLQRINDVL